MKKKLSRKERLDKGAPALAQIVEEHFKNLPVEEQERRFRAFARKVSELKKRSV